MSKKKASKAGRPTDYDPIYCEMLIKHMEDGLSYESFAGVVGCCEKTLYNWESEFPEFLQAKNKGKPKCRLWWEKTGRDGLHNETIKDGDGMTVTKSINATIWIFNMKNRFGWRNNDEPKAPAATDPTKDPCEDYTDEELDKL